MKLMNAIGFNVIWFGCIFYRDDFIPFALCFLLIHFLLLKHKFKEVITIITVVTIGLVIDTLLVYFHVFYFPPESLSSVFAIPLWLIVLWAAFASTLNHSLAFMKTYPSLKYLAGIVIAPLSYLAGYNFNAVGFGYSVTTTFLILSGVWFIFMMAIFPIINLRFYGK